MSGSPASEGDAAFDPFAGSQILKTAPSTDPQREIWTATQAGVEASLCFNESVTLRFADGLDLDALRASFAELVARHEALRATFTSDGLTLCILESGAAPGTFDDWSALSVTAREARFRELLQQTVETPFDLQTGPLFRVHYIRLTPDDTRVVLTVHHIVCDGWSTAVLVTDWAKLYNARLVGAKAELPEAVAFSAYSAQQRTGSDQPQADDETYWLKQFQAGIPVLELPCDRQRPPLRTYAARRLDFKLDAELVQAVKKSGAKLRSSLFATLLAGFEALLFRLTGQDELVVGIPIAGQAVDGYDSLVGHCVNTLPLRSTLAAGQTFSELVAATRQTVLDAYEHQAYTFGTLLTKLPIARDPSRLPLVSVVFNLDRGLTNDAIGFEGVHVELDTNPRRYENFDLFLNAVELADGVVLECQYNIALFDEATIQRWLSAYRLLLTESAANPSLPIQSLPIVPAEEHALLARWNEQTRVAYPEGACVHELIEAQVRATPLATACEFEGQTLSYQELDRRANRLARRLRALGVGKGARVGLCLERSPKLLVGLLGILKAGAAYVPLDPGYPLDRLSYMVSDAALSALVTESKTRAELSLAASVIVSLDSDEALLSEQDNQIAPSERDANAGDTAYVIYTSGSSGKPKGVLVPHRSVVNLLRSVRETPGLTSSDVVLAVTTLSFDIAVSELLLPLTVGAKIVLATREAAADGARLHELMLRSGVTFIDATPATYRLLLGAGWNGDRRLKVICTGESMPKDLALELVKRCGSLWNGYGPTETTVWSTFYEVKAPIERILIGRPIANTQIYVLDSDLQPTPIGVPGELFIAGAGVTLGYLDRPELTAQRFVPDPFANTRDATPSGAQMYKTGDLGRYLNDGQLECLGRNDNQVKLRGYRIELGEIENALGLHASVKQSAVIVREDRADDPRLVGYVVLEPGAALSIDVLRAHLRQSLPDYMVPASYVQLSNMPLTPSGKIDRKALAISESAPAQVERDFIAPTGATQRLVAELFQEVLAVPRVSIHDDFFALGGHSLLASRMLARLRHAHGIELSFRKIFEAPSVAGLAAIIDSSASDAAPAVHSVIERRTDQGPAPLSISQERQWLLEEMDPSQKLVHNLPAAWRCAGAVDVVLLQRAVDEIARRHETLRTTLGTQNGRIVQLVAPHVELPIQTIDLFDRPAPEQALLSEFERCANECFDLFRGPLFRSYLFRVAKDECVYLVVLHNIIWDGWSFDIFLRELTTAYGAFERGDVPQLPELSIAYSDFARWQRGEFLESPALARDIAWWREQLSGTPPELALPTDRPRPVQSNHTGHNVTVHFSRAEADALTALGRAHGATLFTVLFAGFNVLLNRYSGQRDLLVGTPVRARNRPEFEPLIGPFMNAVAVRTRLDADMSFDALVRYVRDVTLDAFSHEDMPLDKLGTRPPVVRAFFSFQDARDRPPGLGSIPVSQIQAEPPAAGNDLMLWMMEKPAELLAVLNFSTELFDIESAERLLRGFTTIMRAVIARPTTPIGTLPVAAEVDLVRARGWGRPESVPTSDPIALIDSHARAKPDAIAVSDGKLSISYAELQAQSEGVASLLREAGSGRLSLVGVYATTPFARVVGVLGALRAGVAFVLIDPAHPLPWNTRLCAQLEPDWLLAPVSAAVPDGLPCKVMRYGTAGPAKPFVSTECATADPACVCPRSGAGRPVASTVSRASLASSALSVANALGLTADHNVVGLSSVSAELALLELLAPLMVGAQLVLPGEMARIDRLGLGAIDALFAPPSSWSRLGTNELALPRRALVLGQPSGELVHGLLAAGKSVYRLEAYSEAGLAPSVERLSQAYDARCSGRPLFPLRARIVASDGSECAAGMWGELQVATAAEVDRARDRWSRERERGTDEAWRATGERARWSEAGSILLQEPQDARAEIAGHRCDLDEIAVTLERHPSVRRALARCARGKGGAIRLAAYVVTQAGGHTETELRRHVRASLPEFMVPQIFVELDAIPTTGSGDVDLARLPAAFGTESGDAHVAPRTDAERLLAEVWCEALGLARVSVYDNFFALGGHSLLCFEVLARLEHKTAKRLSPRVMLLGSLEQVALEMTQGSRQPNAPRPPPTAAPTPTPPQATERDARFAGRFLKKLKRIVGS